MLSSCISYFILAFRKFFQYQTPDSNSSDDDEYEDTHWSYNKKQNPFDMVSDLNHFLTIKVGR